MVILEGFEAKSVIVFFALLWIQGTIFIAIMVDWPLMIIPQIILGYIMYKIICDFRKYDIKYEDYFSAKWGREIKSEKYIEELKCPFCEKELQPDWKICRHCKKVLPDQ